jgi:LmbE family N-acetylglucosaminyl deacetylase
MKTTLERLPMPADNAFKITTRWEEYTLLQVTAEEGKDKVVVSFPWHDSFDPEHPLIKAAVKKTLDTAKDHLLQYLESKKRIEDNKKKKTPCEKLMSAVGRELKFLWSKICL